MYADDVKIFHIGNNCGNYNLLQQDLDSFFVWCNTNLMDLNLNKCKHMHFSRKTEEISSFFLNGYKLELVDSIVDLGILFDVKLNFNQHITLISNKARGVLAFIKRWAKEFSDPYITKQLYTSLVRPILEFGSIIWNPQYNLYSDKIESVQKQFLLFCLRHLFRYSVSNLPSYKSRLALIKLPTLQSRRTMLNVTFVIKLINGDVCSSFLLSNLSFNIPSRPTRNFNPLHVQFFRRNYANDNPLRIICCDFNNLYHLIDFSVSVNIIKRNIIVFLNS